MAQSTIKGAYKLLHNKRAVLPDFLGLVFDVLERSTIEKFVNHIWGLKTNQDQQLKVINLAYLLAKAGNN